MSVALPTKTEPQTALFVSRIAELRSGNKTNGDADFNDSGDELAIILFEVGKSFFAFQALSVTEVVEVSEIVKIPRAPEIIEGVIEIREQVIPVVDLRKKLGFHREVKARFTIIVAVVGTTKTGFIVDSAQKVLALGAEEMQDLGTVISGPEARYIYRTINRGNQPIVILNIDTLLSANEISSLASIEGDKC